jgi:hypothetical protein
MLPDSLITQRASAGEGLGDEKRELAGRSTFSGARSGTSTVCVDVDAMTDLLSPKREEIGQDDTPLEGSRLPDGKRWFFRWLRRRPDRRLWAGA